jgi:hypothetical protein
MKCHSLLKSTLRNALLITLLASACASQQTAALPTSCDDIDTMQEFIKDNLRQASPENIVAYEKYEALFEGLLDQFLNRANDSSIATHVANFDRALAEFHKNIVTNPRYASVQEATHLIFDKYSKLVAVLRGYIGKKEGALSLLQGLSPYIKWAPRKIRAKYSNPLSLIGCITYRLQCS